LGLSHLLVVEKLAPPERCGERSGG